MLKLSHPSLSEKGRNPPPRSPRHSTQHDVYVMIQKKWVAVKLERAKDPRHCPINAVLMRDARCFPKQGRTISLGSSIKDPGCCLTMRELLLPSPDFSGLEGGIVDVPRWRLGLQISTLFISSATSTPRPVNADLVCISLFATLLSTPVTSASIAWPKGACL